MQIRGEDLTGKRFGRLVAIKPTGKANGHGVLWLCKCDCGNTKETRVQYLKSGGTRSCGCYDREVHAAIVKQSAKWNTKHGQCRRTEKHHPLYGVWGTMRGRCERPNHISYKNYGAKGIKVCEEWQDFQTFFNWAMSHGYQRGLAIDRIDPNGNYCPENCRFLTQAENNRNRGNAIYLTINGKKQLLVDWARETGQPRARLHNRYYAGWSDYEIVYGRA